MNRKLTQIIEEQTVTFLHNVDTAIQTCDLDFTLNGIPVWKQMYHALHSLDRWFINPKRYEEPSFHDPDLNSMHINTGKAALSRNELIAYFEAIKIKIAGYLNGLTDDMLGEKPDGCKFTRLALILGQYRHMYSHIGIINCTTIVKTGKWPRIVGLDGDFSGGLYE